MSSGGSKPLDDIADFVVNKLTGGLVGYEEGKIKKGLTSRSLDEGIGEISGRNMQRKAQMEAKDAVEIEKTAKIKDIKDQQEVKKRQDLAASQYADASRKSSTIKKNISLGSQEQDFLGL